MKGDRKKTPKSKKTKTQVVFDETKRRDFLTGFRKRKNERRKKAAEKHERNLKAEIKLAREKAREDVMKADSASHRVVPEIQHLLEQTHPTDVHTVGSHTVSVTHLELDKVNETPDMGLTSKQKKLVSKQVTKSINKLKTPTAAASTTKTKKTKRTAKFQKKTAKSKRTKHHNPKKVVPQ